MAQVSGRFVKRYSAEMAVQMAWAYAVAEVRHEKLFEELTDFISRHASVFEAHLRCANRVDRHVFIIV